MDVSEAGVLDIEYILPSTILLRVAYASSLVSRPTSLEEQRRLCRIRRKLTYAVRSTFSGAFQTGALTALPKSSIIFNVFINIAEYILFTAICYWVASPPEVLTKVINGYVADSRLGSRLPGIIRKVVTVKKMPKELVVAVCFCGAAKTTSVGIPLAAAMWSQLDNFTISSIQVPVLLYTVEQVFIAQFFTIFFKWWLHRSDKGLLDAESATTQEENQAADELDDNLRDAGNGNRGVLEKAVS